MGLLGLENKVTVQLRNISWRIQTLGTLSIAGSHCVTEIENNQTIPGTARGRVAQPPAKARPP